MSKPSTDPVIKELRSMRKAKGLFQKELAKAIGTTQHELSDWECGVREPRLATLNAWANALGFRLRLDRELPR